MNYSYKFVMSSEELKNLAKVTAKLVDALVAFKLAPGDEEYPSGKEIFESLKEAFENDNGDFNFATKAVKVTAVKSYESETEDVSMEMSMEINSEFTNEVYDFIGDLLDDATAFAGVIPLIKRFLKPSGDRIKRFTSSMEEWMEEIEETPSSTDTPESESPEIPSIPTKSFTL